MAVRNRSVLLFTFSGFVLVLVGLVATKWSVWWLAPVYWLNHFQVFHIVVHFSIFAGVVMLYGPQNHSAMRLWVVVLSGAVLLELVQFILRGFPLSRASLLDSVFDIVVDVTGAAVCWRIVTQRRHRKTLSLSSDRLLKS